MIYDLNIHWTPATGKDKLLQALVLASSLGYDTVAISHTLELPFPANPTSPLPHFPASSSEKKLPTVLHRATLPLSDPAASNYRLPSLMNVYDIIAIRPLTEKAFQNACLTLDIPIISLDFTQRFPFHFRPKPCMAAVTRGVRFEICYSQLLSGDNKARGLFIGNVTSLIRATRGRGIIISSEAKTALDLRAPADVINLLNVWGLPGEKGSEALRAIPRSIVVNEGIKRKGFRGIINVVETATPPNKSRNGSDTDVAVKSGTSMKRKNHSEAGQPSEKKAKKANLAARPGGNTTK